MSSKGKLIVKMKVEHVGNLVALLSPFVVTVSGSRPNQNHGSGDCSS